MATELEILITATDKASGPLKNVSGAVDNLGKRATGTNKMLGGLTSTLGTSLKLGVLAGGAALAGLGFAVAKTGVDFNNLKQQAEIAFETMLGSGEKARAFLDDLQDFAAKTPFEFPDLLRASQRLLAMGFAADEIRPTLTAIGDAVAGLGGGAAEVDRVTTALGQMQAKGKASAEEMMQLTEAGIPAWQFLADAIGTDVAGAMDAVSKGAVSADVAIGALVEGMNTKFGGMMEKQSTTFGGLLSTLKDTFTQVSGTVMAPFFDLISRGLQGIVDWTSRPEFKQGVEEFAANVQTFVETATTNMTTLVNNLQGTFGTIQGTIFNTIGWIRLAWDADWGAIRSTWETFAAEMPQMHAEFWAEWKRTFDTGSKQNVNDWEGFLGGTFSFLTDWWRLVVTNWTLSLKLLRGEFQLWSSLFSGDWESAWEGFKLALFSFTDIVLNYIEFVFGPGLRDKFAGALNGIWDTLNSWWDTLKSWWNGTIGMIPGMGMLSGTVNITPLAVGAGGGTTNSYGPVNITQQFYGNPDANTIGNANQNLMREMRQRGE